MFNFLAMLIFQGLWIWIALPLLVPPLRRFCLRNTATRTGTALAIGLILVGSTSATGRVGQFLSSFSFSLALFFLLGGWVLLPLASGGLRARAAGSGGYRWAVIGLLCLIAALGPTLVATEVAVTSLMHQHASTIDGWGQDGGQLRLSQTMGPSWWDRLKSELRWRELLPSALRPACVTGAQSLCERVDAVLRGPGSYRSAGSWIFGLSAAMFAGALAWTLTSRLPLDLAQPHATTLGRLHILTSLLMVGLLLLVGYGRFSELAPLASLLIVPLYGENPALLLPWLLLALLLFAAGVGVLRGERWGRWLALIYAGASVALALAAPFTYPPYTGGVGVWGVVGPLAHGVALSIAYTRPTTRRQAEVLQ